MIEAEPQIRNQPYSEIGQRARIKAAILEIPSGTVTLCKHFFRGQKLPNKEAQTILTEAIERLDGSAPESLKLSPKITHKLGQGFESTGFVFDTKEGRWVVKIGLPKNCVSGVYSPSTNEYASTMIWNYNALNDTYQTELPYVIPSPYFVVPPGGQNLRTTVQIQPYVEQVTDTKSLTSSQKDDLISERLAFYALSRSMLKRKKVMPDLVKQKNLIIGTRGGQPHYVLVDVGLFHLQAPTPTLNLLVYFSQRLSLSRDIRILKKANNSITFSRNKKSPIV